MSSSTKSPKRKRAAAAEASVGDAIVAVTDEQAVESASDESTVGSAAATSQALTLASICIVKDAAALKDTLCAVVSADEPVVIDASSVERIDTAAIQLLCAFVRERTGRNQSVVWQGASAAFQEAAQLLGVRALLALPENPADSLGAAA